MKAIEPRIAGARQLESEGFRFHPASTETGTRGQVAMNMERPCLFHSVIPAKAGIRFGHAWERGRLARFAWWRAPAPALRSAPAGETPAFPGSTLQGFRIEANGKST